MFYMVGYAFAYGTHRGNSTPFIGIGNFFLMAATDAMSHVNWFFQWAFAAAATTIVAGAIAERCRFEAYMVHSALMTGVVYPVVAHWCAQAVLTVSRSPICMRVVALRFVALSVHPWGITVRYMFSSRSFAGFGTHMAGCQHLAPSRCLALAWLTSLAAAWFTLWEACQLSCVLPPLDHALIAFWKMESPIPHFVATLRRLQCLAPFCCGLAGKLHNLVTCLHAWAEL